MAPPAADHRPRFRGGRLKEAFPAIWAASEAAVARMGEGVVEVELAVSHAAADVIFRTLFSIPIEDRVAQAVFHEFRAYQRSAPILNLAAFLPLPRWFPRLHRRGTLRSARVIRGLITGLTAERAAAIASGTAPQDLATKIMTTPDPVTGAVSERRRWSTRWRSSFWPGMRPVLRPWAGPCIFSRLTPICRSGWRQRRRRCSRFSGRSGLCASPGMCSARRCGFTRRCR